MKLSELLEKEGFTSVNDRTNISIENLIKLVDNDFEELNRVKALGFLSILRREYYSIELDDIESAIKEYFEENILEEDTQVLVTAERKEKDSGLFKWIIIVALLGGLWYLYSSGKLGGNLSNADSKENILKDSEVLQNSIVKENLVIVKEDENKTEVKTQTLKTTPMTEDNSSKIDEAKKSKETEANKTTERIEVKTEENSSEKPKSSDKDKDSQERETEIEIDNVETVLNETTEEIINTDENSIKTSEETSSNEDEKAEIIYNVTVNPRVNLWFGFINLDTKARKEFITTESTSIDVGEQRWVLITGHGRLSLSSELTTLKINDSAKHYFYIDSSEIREVDRAEFKELNDGRGW